jgi:hypothetical protein
MFLKVFLRRIPTNSFIYSNETQPRTSLVIQKKRIAESVILLLHNFQEKLPAIFKRKFETFTEFQDICYTISCGTTNNVLQNTGWERACIGVCRHSPVFKMIVYVEQR